MTKSTVTKIFVGSLIAIASGLVLFVVAGLVAYGNNSFVMNGPDVVGVKPTLFGSTMVALAALGIIVMAGAAIAQLVAWVGAVLNTALLENKTWFIVLLLTGLLSFGFIAMIIYLIVGPDGTAARAERSFGSRQPVPTS
jgi:hypothetical protein